MAMSLGAYSMAGPLIEEGFFFDGVEGTLKKDTKTENWIFALSDPVKTNYNIIYPAGEPIAMLPCSVLEQMADLAGSEGELHVMLSALFTEYNEKNYLFSVSFLPLQKNIPQPAKEETNEAPGKPDENKPTQEKTQVDSIIPTDILNQIKSQKTPDLKTYEIIAKVTGDSNLIGRSGYLTKRNGIRFFELDGLGLNVDKNKFFLLPNTERAKAEGRMMHTPGRQRYNVSGLVTTYQGKTYMLLRRATRTFSHGNFSD